VFIFFVYHNVAIVELISYLMLFYNREAFKEIQKGIFLPVKNLFSINVYKKNISLLNGADEWTGCGRINEFLRLLFFSQNKQLETEKSNHQKVE
jgi:hypothetical protein